MYLSILNRNKMYYNSKVNDWVIALNAKGITNKVNHSELGLASSQFGFSLGNGVWHWFTFDDAGIEFYHTYSQNTGKSFRGVSHRLEVYARIEKLTGISFY